MSQEKQPRNVDPNNPLDALYIIDGLLQPGVVLNRPMFALADMCLATLLRAIQAEVAPESK
jgi:hypothetical protein